MLYKTCLVNILENVFVLIEILFKILLFIGGVLIHAEHCKTITRNSLVAVMLFYFVILTSYSLTLN